MSQSRHPEFSEEEDVLERVMEELRRDKELVDSADLGGVHSAANLAVMKELRAIGESHDEAMYSYPYFGRIDYDRNGDVTRLYIGRSFFQGANVLIVSHNSSVADLFYDEEEQASVNGEPVRLLLSRQLEIERGVLRSMFDRVDRRRGGSGIVASSAIQDHLLRQLAVNGAKGLRDIAETMLREQRAIIRAPAGASVIINGVAGSGKTSIAYHRLSYLLSRDNELRLDLEPRRSLFVGPSEYFTRFASTLLPSLQLNQIRHTSFADLALSAMPRSGKGTGTTRNRYRLRDNPGESSRSPSSRDVAKRRGLKGSRRFAAVLERLSQREIGLKRLERPLVLGFEVEARVIELSQSDFDESFKDLTKKPGRVATQRRSMVDELLRRSTGRFWALHGEPIDTVVEQSWRMGIRNEVGRVWPPMTARDIYYDWLQDRAAVASIGKGHLTAGMLSLLLGSPQAPRGRVNAEDLYAIYYLHLLLAGSSTQFFDHIVLDEGQDFSVVQLMSIKKLSRSRVFTVLGDVAQRIIRSESKGWEDAATTLDVLPGNIKAITQSYRSTAEIVEFTNRVLRASTKDAVLARPVPRHGDRPRVFSAPTSGAMVAAIADELQHLQQAFGNVAVLARSPSAARGLVKSLQSRGVAVTHPRDGDPPSSGSVTILPVELSKGVEFDAVVVADVSSKAYPRSGDTDGQLLYIAVTRAMHYLSLHFTGRPSEFLQPFFRDYLVSPEDDA